MLAYIFGRRFLSLAAPHEKADESVHRCRFFGRRFLVVLMLFGGLQVAAVGAMSRMMKGPRDEELEASVLSHREYRFGISGF